MTSFSFLSRQVFGTGLTAHSQRFGHQETADISQQVAGPSEDSLDLSMHERQFRERMDRALAYQYGGDTIISQKEQQYLRAFYKDQYPLKSQELKTLRKQKVEKQQQLQALQNGRLGANTKMLGLTMVGGAIEAVVHAVTGGLSLPLHGIGPAVGGLASKALVTTPEAVEAELDDIKDQEEQLEVYLANLKHEYNMRFSKKPISSQNGSANRHHVKPFVNIHGHEEGTTRFAGTLI